MLRPRFLADPADDLGFDDEFMSAIDATAEDQNVIVLDPIGEFVDTDTSGWIGADGIHPNRQGELELTAALIHSLQAHGMTAAS